MSKQTLEMHEAERQKAKQEAIRGSSAKRVWGKARAREARTVQACHGTPEASKTALLNRAEALTVGGVELENKARIRVRDPVQTLRRWVAWESGCVSKSI